MAYKSLHLGFLFNILVATFTYVNSATACTKNSSLVGFESEFVMVQHQLRGYFNIIDDCSFRVSNFDMLSGYDVHWWGASGPSFDNLTSGFVISDDVLNQTYKNESFIVNLRKNVSWDQIRVVSVWDEPTYSDFGHVILGHHVPGSVDYAPGPSEAPDNETGVGWNETGASWFTEPTMFDNCKELSKNFRVRWSLNVEENFIDIGLEAAIGIQYYMAFGWTNHSLSSDLMLDADVAFTGFTEEGMPFADDYYITKYSECVISKDGAAQGVCPDTIYENTDPVGLVNNTLLLYGHRKDGVSLIRYRRPLKSIDLKYDLPINYTANLTVIWALGTISPPDNLRPYYLPQIHTGPRYESHGDLVLNVSEHVNDCFGPLDAEHKEDQDLVIADVNAPLVVTAGPALHYPNPPNPPNVLYINKKEAPVLRVERGVAVKFSIQAGHNVPFFITSDPVGGNATLRNMTEIIYAGGADAQGVQASPKELTWYPDRNTPDQVYYQSAYEPKMGWRVQVVDGGLSDMYNSSVVLDDQQVKLFWTLSESSISIAARSEKKSGYLAIGFGSGMVNSYAYVGWMDGDGKGRVNTYWIDGKDASSIHPTSENLTYVRCKSENGIITLEFTRPLSPSCTKEDRPECKNIIEPTTPLKVIWAMGAKWSEDNLSEMNMHSAMSSRPVLVMLMRGTAEAEQDLRPVLTVHGFMMFLAWGILLPGGILAARYLKHVKGDGWYQIHVYLQYSGLAVVLLGLLFAVAELRGFSAHSLHVKFGLAAIFLACAQPVNAYFRPKRPANGEDVSSNRIIWENIHVITGRSAIVVGIAALVSGLKHLGDRYGGENVGGLYWALIFWFLIGALTVMYLEYREKKRRREITFARANWVLGNLEEDDSADLLSPSGILVEKESNSSERMEVQLEPLNR
ncbi:hypothetical protein RJ641_022119 [Dillenia turbinata]|uniref:Cytochrome b561 domain-containing protein n=1 Tax=Dillenia turbinata TaxID=194707 RepID=A0AAN8U8X9_9MAGN